MKKINVHLVSDSTGETVGGVARAALVQFENVESEEHIWTLVRSESQLERVIEGIRENPGVIMYTLVDNKLRDMLKLECARRGLPCIAVLANVVSELSSYLGQESQTIPWPMMMDRRTGIWKMPILLSLAFRGLPNRQLACIWRIKVIKPPMCHMCSIARSHPR
jgi:hypothetical protein